MIRGAVIALVLAAVAAILVAGCGGGGGSDEIASLVPPSASAYLESVVRPEGEQRDAIESLASRVGGINDPGPGIVQQLDAEFSQSGVNATYDDDVAPWLGERAGVFFQSFNGDPPPFAVVFETTDADAAQSFLDKVVGSSPRTKHGSYRGVDYIEDPSGTYASGIVGGFLVYGTLDAFKAAVDASNGSSLADSGAFTNGTATLPDDNLVLGYADGQEAAKQITGTPIDPLRATVLRTAIKALINGPVTFAVSGTPDTASLDLSVPSGIGLAGGDLVGHAPADSWFAIGVQNIGGILGNAVAAADSLGISSLPDQIRQATGVDLKDAASWMHNGYFSVAGTSEKDIHIGAVVGSSDPKESLKEIAAAKKRVQADVDANLSGPRVKAADAGFSATAPESPQAIDVAQVGQEVVAALGPGRPAEEELMPRHPLSAEARFKAGMDALGTDFLPLEFVSLPQFFVVAEKGGSANDPSFVAAKPYLRKLSYLLAGTSSAEDRTTVRFVVGVK